MRTQKFPDSVEHCVARQPALKPASTLPCCGQRLDPPEDPRYSADSGLGQGMSLSEVSAAPNQRQQHLTEPPKQLQPHTNLGLTPACTSCFGALAAWGSFHPTACLLSPRVKPAVAALSGTFFDQRPHVSPNGSTHEMSAGITAHSSLPFCTYYSSNKSLNDIIRIPLPNPSLPPAAISHPHPSKSHQLPFFRTRSQKPPTHTPNTATEGWWGPLAAWAHPNPTHPGPGSDSSLLTPRPVAWMGRGCDRRRPPALRCPSPRRWACGLPAARCGRGGQSGRPVQPPPRNRNTTIQIHPAVLHPRHSTARDESMSVCGVVSCGGGVPGSRSGQRAFVEL